MSLGGRDEPSLGVLVYGPDGRAYGSPAEARNAGVSNPTMSPPVDVPLIPYGRAATPLNPALPQSDFEGSFLGPDLRVSNIQSAPQPIAPVIQPYTPAPQPIAPVIQQFNPMGEASPAVITYGPDGRAYGSPAEARNAGVSNPTMSPPAGVPISYPGRQPYMSAPMPYIPTPASGGRNRYAEIMSQFGQSQPFSFFGMPSGGFNPYASDYTGGFTPYQRTFTPQPIVNPVEPTVPMVGGDGGGGRGGADREGPSAFSQLTPAERAAYYRKNPIEGSLSLAGQDALGWTTLGAFSKAVGPDAWYDSRLEKMGVNPTINLENQNTLAGEAMQRALDSQAQSQRAAEAQASREASAQASLAPGAGSGGGGGNRDGGIGGSSPGDTGRGGGGGNRDGGGGGYGGGGEGGGGAATGGNNGDASGGGDRGTRGGFAQGGHVSMMHLQGPNPIGPDDGYGALKDGEYVINDKAVKKYGIELMNLINSGKISKGKLRGLLEM